MVNNLEKSLDQFDREERPKNWQGCEPQPNSRPASGQRLESDRFIYLFNSLNFEVKDWRGKSIEELRSEVDLLKQDKDIGEHQALAFMIVTHGQNDRVFGVKACEQFHKIHSKNKYGTITKEDRKLGMALKDEDSMPVTELVSLFSNFDKLKGKPKLIFITCCRSESNPTVNVKGSFLKNVY